MSQVTHHSGEAEHRRKSRFSRSLMETHMMAYNNKDDPRKVRADDNESPSNSASTLLPMLVGSLVLTITVLVVVMMIV